MAGWQRCSPSPAAAGRVNGKGPRRLTIGWPRGSQAGIGQRKGAGPPSGMYYGASGTSVRAGGARAWPGLRGGSWGRGARRVRAKRTGFPTCSFRAARARGVRELGRVHSETRARKRPPGGRARAGRPRSRGRASSALSPAPPPFSPSGFLSFLSFFFFFFQ